MSSMIVLNSYRRRRRLLAMGPTLPNFGEGTLRAEKLTARSLSRVEGSGEILTSSDQPRTDRSTLVHPSIPSPPASHSCDASHYDHNTDLGVSSRSLHAQSRRRDQGRGATDLYGSPHAAQERQDPGREPCES
jgi:hypothetical protein